MKKKPCSKCGRRLSLGSFYKHPMTADGRLNTCKECHLRICRERAKTPEAMARSRDVHAAWRAANPNRVKEIRDRADKKYRGSARDVVRRGRRKNREESGDTVSLAGVLKKHGMFCSICQTPIEHKGHLGFDHVIPLARDGRHTEENLRPAHRKCNSWKGSRLPEEIAGLVTPDAGTFDDWQVRRDRRANQLRSEGMKKAWQEKDWSARNSKVSESMKGNTNGSLSKGVIKARLTEKQYAARAEAVRKAYEAWTPERRAEHALKISNARRAGIAQRSLQ